MTRDEILKALNLTILLTIINIAIGVIWNLVDSSSQITAIATGLGFLEFAVFLITGACLMARDPINEEDRFDEMSFPTSRYKMVILGKVLMVSAIMLFLMIGLLFVLGSLLHF